MLLILQSVLDLRRLLFLRASRGTAYEGRTGRGGRKEDNPHAPGAFYNPQAPDNCGDH